MLPVCRTRAMHSKYPCELHPAAPSALTAGPLHAPALPKVPLSRCRFHLKTKPTLNIMSLGICITLTLASPMEPAAVWFQLLLVLPQTLQYSRFEASFVGQGFLSTDSGTFLPHPNTLQGRNFNGNCKLFKTMLLHIGISLGCSGRGGRLSPGSKSDKLNPTPASDGQRA